MPCALRQKTFVRRRLLASVAPPEGRLEFHFRPNDAQNYTHVSSLFCLTQHSSIATAPGAQWWATQSNLHVHVAPGEWSLRHSLHSPLDRWCRARCSLLDLPNRCRANDQQGQQVIVFLFLALIFLALSFSFLQQMAGVDSGI